MTISNTLRRIALASSLATVAIFSSLGALAGDDKAHTKADVMVHEQAVGLAGTGTFTGLSKHVTSGGVSIVTIGDQNLVILENNFSLDGAPGPTLGFGTDGKFDAKTEFSPLKSKTGAQVYVLPASIDPANYNEIYVWCADFTVPLGVAKIGS